MCGHRLPPGLRECEELPEPIFLRRPKAETGHDENIPFERAVELVGRERAEEARAASLKLYSFAREHAEARVS